MRRFIHLLCIALFALVSQSSWAAESGEKIPSIPPAGVDVPEADAKELHELLAKLQQSIERIAKKNDAKSTKLLPDVQIFASAVRYPLDDHEFLNEKEIGKAKEYLKQGQARADELEHGKASWTSATGHVLRGYVSKIDGSVQPFGVTVPENYQPVGADRFRLDIWLHGRGEQLTELNFLRDRDSGKPDQFEPADTIVLHPYGRYCNAFKFAGEVDVLEALEATKRDYRIDEDRIAMRGFSMGGAGVWHLAVHYADRWAAANPGAGFAETAEFLKVFQKEDVAPAPYERKLYNLYDATAYAGNLFHCPTVAYSGEIDTQKQAADIMAIAMHKEGLELRHIIGPQTKHQYHPDSKIIVQDILNSILDVGRERTPLSLHLTTYTLKYNRLDWVTIDALDDHWTQAKVDGQMLDSIDLITDNVSALTLSIPPGRCPFDINKGVDMTVDAQELTGPTPFSDRSWVCHLRKVKGADGNDAWQIGELPADDPVRKRHDLQGPIDDAFMDSFLIVKPTGKSKHPAVEKWVQAEMDRAIREWRRQFRGEAKVKNDVDVTDDDIAKNNLALWGDAESNKLIGKIAGKLPIKWDADRIVAGAQIFPSDHHALILIQPNPLNVKRYVVLNSGFTFREYDYLNNARQVPKLPDWAVIDLDTPPDAHFPGKVAAADFFDELWQLKKAK